MPEIASLPAIPDTPIPVMDLNGQPLTPCSPEKARQNLEDGLAIFADGVLHLNYRPLAYRRVYRLVRRRDGLTCAWCHGPGSTLEHVLPICRGGRTSLDNCVIACRSCNHSRNNALPSEFIAWTHFKPTHPVILRMLHHESEVLAEAAASLGERPIQSCLSKEEAQIWVAFRQAGYRLQPPPPKPPATRIRLEAEPFTEIFLP